MERAAKSIAKLKLPQEVSKEQLVLAVWPEVIGKRLASRAVAVALVRDKLVVEVEDAIWQKQLYFLRYQIVDKSRKVLGEGVVNEVEFRVAVRRRPPQVALTAAPVVDRIGNADSIKDPVLRILYNQAKKKASA